MSEFFVARGRRFDLSRRNLVMGILNVTPDSFSDGGLYFEPEHAIAHGLQIANAGADIIDVGGESSRPGAPTVPIDEQIRRITPVIEALTRRTGLAVSVDTTRRAVAEAALAAGASILNDITGLAADPGLGRLAAQTGAGLVLMHMRGTPETMQDDTNYDDLFGEIVGHLRAGIDRATSYGVKPEQIVVDPGIGFAKTAEQNMEILANLESLAILGRPILMGLSRKAFLGGITGRDAPNRGSETIAASIFAARHGARIHRVHDVAEVAAALKVHDALVACEGLAPG